MKASVVAGRDVQPAAAHVWHCCRDSITRIPRRRNNYMNPSTVDTPRGNHGHTCGKDNLSFKGVFRKINPFLHVLLSL